MPGDLASRSGSASSGNRAWALGEADVLSRLRLYFTKKCGHIPGDLASRSGSASSGNRAWALGEADVLSRVRLYFTKKIVATFQGTLRPGRGLPAAVIEPGP